MALMRAYDKERGGIVISVHDGYKDRLYRWSDIREYLPVLHWEARSREKPRILELGSRKGNSTLAFLSGTADRGGHVWSVDITDVTQDPEGMLIWRKLPNWTFIHGDDMDPEVQGKMPAEVDVLFIDTSHEYDHTLAELHAFMPKVAPGGVALFHDTRLWMHVVEDAPPVTRALNDYCKETGETWEELPGQYGLGVLRR